MQTTYLKTAGTAHWSRLITAFTFAAFLAHTDARGGQTPVNLGTAGDFVILTKTGISSVPPSAVTGDLGVSPIDSTAITGFSLILDGSGQFSTSSQVTGKAYAANYATPTPVALTTAVGDMQTAYTDAAGRTLPDHTELGSGNIGGMTLASGLYKWGTAVTIPTDVTLSGGPNDVWIFQIAGNLTIAGATSVILSGGAQARNIFWQVAGGVGVDLGTTSHFEGIILAQAGINLETGASINGMLLGQTAVTLDANTVTKPAPQLEPPSFGPLSRASDGTMTLVITNTPGVALTLQYSPDLVNWSDFATLTPTTSPYTATGIIAAGAMGFYRAYYQ